jgi:phage terminase large subunit
MAKKHSAQSKDGTDSVLDVGPRLTKREVLTKTAQGIYFREPALWVPDATGYILDDWQKDAINALFTGEKGKTSVAASHGSGKSFLSAVITNLFLCLYSPSRVAATGPTGKQTRSQYWSYTNLVWSRSVFKEDFAWQKTKMYLRGRSEESFAVWLTSKEPKTIEGFHGPEEGENLLWIVEEAKGCGDAVFEAIQGALSHHNNFFYIASTCGGAGGFFFNTFHSLKDSWDTFRIPWYKSSRISPTQVEKWKNTWGEDSPIFQARVMAEFPTDDERVIVPLPWLERAVVGQDEDVDVDEAA